MSAINNNTVIESVNSPATLYTAPAQKSSSFSINICNQNNAPVHVSIAFSLTPNSPTQGEYIEYNQQVDANDVYCRSGLVLSAGHSVVIVSDTANVSINLWGFEEVDS